MIRSIILAAAGLVNRLFGYNLSTATLFSNFTYGSGFPRAHIVKEDGTKYYLVEAANNRVREYDLPTIYSVQSRTLVSNLSLPTSPSGIFFKPDGTKLYVVSSGTDRVYSYTLSTPWTISTATQDAFNRNMGFDLVNVYLDTTGTIIFFANGSNSRIDTYTLSTAWDLSTISTSALRTFSIGISIVDGLSFNNDGTKMYTGSDLYSARVREYTLSTPWNTATATFSYDLSTNFDYVSGISFAKSGFKMYIVDFNSGKFREYNLTA